MPRHYLRKQPTRLTAVMAAITATVLALGLWGVWHSRDSNDPGRVCQPIPGTGRLNC